jgi:FKBP-type peptidyl-prolyl cis-trans isomerase FklB
LSSIYTSNKKLKGVEMRLFLTVMLFVGLTAGYVFAGEQIEIKNQKDKLSYSLGVDIGEMFKNQSIDVNSDLFVRGLKDVLSGNKLLLADQEIKETMDSFQKERVAKHKELNKEASETNKKAGDAFLAENKQKPGVVTMPSGLQYIVIKKGTGRVPKITDTVVTNYRGTLVDGTEFDSSYKRGQPATFPVKSVIPGWTEALQLMKEGAKWQLFLPAELAYGERGAGNIIGPNSTLIFDIELISVK